MKTIQIIDLDGRPAALAAGGAAIIAGHVAPALLAHVQAKALYALQIQAGERPGPYADSDAEHYARSAVATTGHTGAARLTGGAPVAAHTVSAGPDTPRRHRRDARAH